MIDVLAISKCLSDAGSTAKRPASNRFRTYDDSAEVESLNSPKRAEGRKTTQSQEGSVAVVRTPVRRINSINCIIDESSMSFPDSPTSVMKPSSPPPAPIFQQSDSRRSESVCYRSMLSLYLDEMSNTDEGDEYEELIGIFLLPDDMEYSSDDDETQSNNSTTFGSRVIAHP